ncbi:MAG: amino acid adenylation domain-containing protein [Xenococcaceae cyanobacterium]
MKLENVADIYPLSPVQEGMLFHTLAAPTSEVYFGQYTCRIQGDLQVSAFQAAWQQVLNRHSALRTAFLWDGLDEPLQVVRQQVELPRTDRDWRRLSSREQEARWEKFLRADRRQGFDLAQAPLMRLTLIRQSEDTYQFIWSCHHLLSDGWSASLIWKEVFAFYIAIVRGQCLNLKSPRPYGDYIAWLQEQDLSKAKVFWQDALKGFTVPTPLRVDRVFPGQSGSSYDRQQIALPEATTAALQSLARHHRLTLNTLIHGAWALLLNRYSGEAEVVYGATVSGRPTALAGVEDMVGLFINTLPVRIRVSGQDSLLPWLSTLQTQLVEIRQYEYTPLVEIQRWSEVPQGRSLFESIVVFENYPLKTQEQDIGLEISDIRFLDQSNYPLALLVVPGASLQLILIYDDRRFEAATIARMLGHMQTVLESFVENPDCYLSDVPLLTKAEQHQLLVEWNQTQAPYPQDACIHHLFEAQVEQTPDAVAVVFEGNHLTYRTLNRRANQLAHHLRSLGVGPDVLVGICMERSLETIVGILGILKAGGAYVPLDPTYPQERLAYILQNTETPVLVTQQRLVEVLPRSAMPRLCLDSDWPGIECESETNPPSQGSSDNLAYGIYTSGSTGQPKGVLVTHRNLVHSTAARIQYYPERVSRFLLLSSFAFDSSVAGIFWSLCQGGTLVLPQQRLEQDMHQLATKIEHQQVTHTLCLPSLYNLLLAHAPAQQLKSLQVVIVAGEACPRSLAEQHHALLPHTSLYNEYGPTEATVWSSVYKVPTQAEESQVPIGRPIANTQIYLLDTNLQPVPIGVPGELYIGGTGVTQGYLNQPECRAEQFIQHPFSMEPNAHLYRTGDLARYRPDGNIEFLGRVDRQVKIRGYRIELGEIEEVLGEHPNIREVVVVARGNDHRQPQQMEREMGHWIEPENTEALVTSLLNMDPQGAEQLLAEIESLSEEEVEIQLRNASQETGDW